MQSVCIVMVTFTLSQPETEKNCCFTMGRFE